MLWMAEGSRVFIRAQDALDQEAWSKASCRSPRAWSCVAVKFQSAINLININHNLQPAWHW